MTQLKEFENLYGRFSCLGTRMTQTNKFRYLNGRFVSLWTEMTYPNKFKTGDRLYSLLFALDSYLKG
jgi:hypothetical protein